MTPGDLEAFSAVMLKNHIRRVSGQVGEGEDFCIEMDSSAFGAVIPETPDVPKDLGAGEKKCPCGHLENSEHNNEGYCIAGACPYTVCHPGATAKPG